MPIGYFVVFSVKGVRCRSEPFSDEAEAQALADHLDARGGVEALDVKIANVDPERLR